MLQLCIFSLVLHKKYIYFANKRKKFSCFSWHLCVVFLHSATMRLGFSLCLYTGRVQGILFCTQRDTEVPLGSSPCVLRSIVVLLRAQWPLFSFSPNPIHIPESPQDAVSGQITLRRSPTHLACYLSPSIVHTMFSLSGTLCVPRMLVCSILRAGHLLTSPGPFSICTEDFNYIVSLVQELVRWRKASIVSSQFLMFEIPHCLSVDTCTHATQPESLGTVESARRDCGLCKKWPYGSDQVQPVIAAQLVWGREGGLPWVTHMQWEMKTF